MLHFILRVRKTLGFRTSKHSLSSSRYIKGL